MCQWCVELRDEEWGRMELQPEIQFEQQLTSNSQPLGLEVLITGSFQDVLARRRHGPILSEVWEKIILSSQGLKGTMRGVPSIGVKIRECF